MDISHLGKWLIYIGLTILILGILFVLGSKMGISFGKLPGDINIHKEKLSIHFPLSTCIILSIVLTLLVNLIFWLMRK